MIKIFIIFLLISTVYLGFSENFSFCGLYEDGHRIYKFYAKLGKYVFILWKEFVKFSV